MPKKNKSKSTKKKKSPKQEKEEVEKEEIGEWSEQKPDAGSDVEEEAPVKSITDFDESEVDDYEKNSVKDCN